MNRLAACLLFLLCWAAPASSAEPPRLSERSWLLPGLWWNPDTSGNGFDVHLSGDTLGVLWYTYREDGSPIWYVAGGEFDAEGVVEAELLEASWGASGMSTQAIGAIRVTRVHSERARLQYRIGDEIGDWDIVPFQYTAQRVEVDPSGAYYRPASSGFGLSIDQFGSAQSAVYYAYDPSGQPQWFLGVRDSSQGPIVFERFRRDCPRCPNAGLTSDLALPASLDTQPGTANLRFHAAPSLLPAEFAQPETLSLLTAPVSTRSADYRPARFDDEATFERFVENSMLDPNVWTWSEASIDFSPAPPAITPPTSSSTNLVEAGVDEADRVKTDGYGVYLYDADAGNIRVAVRPNPDSPHITPLAEPIDVLLPEEGSFHDGKLFLTEDRLVFLASHSSDFFFDLSIAICPPPPEWWLQAKTAVRIFDRSNPSAPELIWRADIDGQLITSRRIGDQLYLVQRFTPFVDGFGYHNTSDAQMAANRALLESTAAADLLPRASIDEGTSAWLDADRVFLPPTADRRAQPDFTVVSRINLQDPTDRETLGLVNGVSAIYVSPDAIYLATSRYDQSILSTSGIAPDWFTSTEIHRIRLEQGLALDATGAVDGWLTSDPLQQPFRLSEHAGVLRVLTVDQLGASGTNLLTQLQESELMPGLLTTVSTLPNLQRPQPIGKPDEFLYASRFVGGRLFASTFRVIDPFYVVDLSDLADPKIAGEVELPGFAEYLHPVSDRTILGVGYQADPRQGLLMGVKLTLFDVSDPAQPRVADQRVIGERGSASALFSSHHAFSALRLDEGRLRIGVPIRVHGQPDPDPDDLPFNLNVESFTHAGLHAFDIVEDAAGGRLESKGVLITAHASNGDYGYDDGAGYDARSILFPSGVAYFNRSTIWTAEWDQLGNPQGPR